MHSRAAPILAHHFPPLERAGAFRLGHWASWLGRFPGAVLAGRSRSTIVPPDDCAALRQGLLAAHESHLRHPPRAPARANRDSFQRHEVRDRMPKVAGLADEVAPQVGTPRPLMVLHVIHSLGFGGAEMSLSLLCRHLDRRRFTPVVCCLDRKGAMAAALEEHGVEVLSLERQPGIRLEPLRRLARLMRSRRPDIVHTHEWPASFWGRVAALTTGASPMIATEHGHAGERRPRHSWMDGILAVFSARVVAVSSELAVAYRRRVRIGSKKIEVIPNGVECDTLVRRFDRERARRILGVTGDVPTVGIVGRLHPVKGHDVFLAAVDLLRARVPGLLALVIGEGSLRATLETSAHALGIADCVRFLGERDNVPDLLGAIDVLMLTSRSEGCPMVALEAMAVGLPTVAPRIAAFEEISDGGATSVLVPPGDATAFAAAALQLLRDERQRSALSSAARERARRHYDVRLQVVRTEQLYERVAQRRGRRADDIASRGQGG